MMFRRTVRASHQATEAEQDGNMVNSELTECVSPSSCNAHHTVSDVVAWQTDRLDTACILDVLGETEQRHVVVDGYAVVVLMHDDLHHVDNLLRPLYRPTIVFAKHHAEI